MRRLGYTGLSLKKKIKILKNKKFYKNIKYSFSKIKFG